MSRKAFFVMAGCLAILLAVGSVHASADQKVNADTDASVQNEAFICVNPYYVGDPLNVVVTYNDIGKTLGASWSPDSGKTWNDVQLPYVWSTTGDPSVACDVNGDLYACFLSYQGTWFFGQSGIFVSKSVDGGRTWQTPVKVDSLDYPGTGPAVPFADKCFLTIDTNSISPYINSIYVGWQRDDTLGSNSDIYFARSTNGGASFTTPIKVNDNLPQTAYAEGAFPFVAADGKLFMTWYDCYFKGGVPGSLYVDISYDGGASFGADARVANFDAPAKYTYAGTGFKAKCFPAAAADPIDDQKAYITYMADPDGYADIRLDGGDDAGQGQSDFPDVSRSGSWVYSAWQDHRNGGGADVYFNRSGDDGKTWQIMATGPLDNGDTPGANQSMRVKLSSSGSNVYCVWEDYRSTGGNPDIYFNYSTNNGQSWASDQHIDGHATALSSYPVIASIGNWVYVVWMDTRSGSGGDIYFVSSPNGGASWNPIMRLDPGTGISQYPVIAAQGTDVYVMWIDNQTTFWEPHFQHSANNGATWLPTSALLASATGTAASTPQLECTGSFVYACWVDNRNGGMEVFFNQSANNGASWTGDQMINDPTVGGWSTHTPELDFEGSYVYVSWLDNRMSGGVGGSDVFLDWSSDNGVTWQAPDIGPIDIGAVGINSGPVRIKSEGSFVYATWLDTRMGPGNHQIFFSRSTNNGAIWGPETHINPGTQPFGLQFSFPVMTAGNGHVNIVWPDLRYVYMAMGLQDIMLNYSSDNGATWLNGPDEADVFCINTQDGGATWSPPVTVNDDATSWAQNLPWVAVRTDGFVDIAYYSFRPTPLDPMIPGAEVRMAISGDFGSSFMASTQIQDTVVTPLTSWVGEYIGIGLIDTIALTVFTDFEQSGGNSDIYVDRSSYVPGADSDGDGVFDHVDNCPSNYNPGQANSDADTHGDSCDNCTIIANEPQTNSDTDSLGDLCDNCPTIDNDDQANMDGDLTGDVCDPDRDGDLIAQDGDGSGVDGDNPCTGGNTVMCDDNCPNISNASQADSDSDGIGDVCDGAGCCGIYTAGITGNANCSSDGKLTLSDITRLIDRVYISKLALCCEASGNCNGSTDCKITLSDITVLIDAVYISKLPPSACDPSCET